MKKKFNNKKNITLLVGGLAALSVLSVGFSGWVIQATNASTTSNVSVTIGDVVDKRLTFKVDDTHTPTALKFDHDGYQGGSDYYLSSETNTSNENLVTSLKFTITGESSTVIDDCLAGGIKITYSSTDIDNLITNGVIVSPVLSGDTGLTIAWAGTNTVGASGSYSVDVNGAEGTGNYTYTVTVGLTYAWGASVNNGNPSRITTEWYNTDENSTLVDKAIEALNAAQDSLSVEFTIEQV